MAVKEKRITIVGCGPGGDGWLGDLARQAIAAAERVAGTPALLARLAPPGAERIDVGVDIPAALERIAGAGAEHRTVVLVTGDPGICSLGQAVIRRFGREHCRVIPGISSVQAAFAALALDWTGARIVGGHARPPDMPPDELARAELIAVLTGHAETIPWLVALAALPGCAWRIHSCRDLTLPDECVEQITAADLPVAAARPRTIVVLERDPRVPQPSLRPSLGTFYGIGTGPGDPGWLTVRGAGILARCAHVFAPKARIKAESLAHSIAQAYVGPKAAVHELLFPMTKDEDDLAVHWRAAAAEVAAVLERGEDACFLTIGDPMLYSTYVYLLRALRDRLPGLAVETVPGVTSFCAAAALTEFTLGEGKEPVTIVPAADDLTAVDAALQRGGTVVLMKIGERLPDILSLLARRGLIDRAVLVARAGQAGQRIETNLRALRPEDSRMGYLSVILVHGEEGSDTRDVFPSTPDPRPSGVLP